MTPSRLVLTAINYIPYSKMKVLAHGLFFRSKIGNNVRLGRVFINCKKVETGNNEIISDRTVFSCNEFYVSNMTKIHSNKSFTSVLYFRIGSSSRIINKKNEQQNVLVACNPAFINNEEINWGANW